MKKLSPGSAVLLMLFAVFSMAGAQNGVAVVTPASHASEGLDLHAVGGLFQESRNLEEFEEELNNPDNGINNLDLNGDGNVDYIRVMEETAGDAHLIVLQAPLGRNEFQDVATIEVERIRGGGYNMQVHGNDVLFGVNFFVAPVRVSVQSWPIITLMYRPVYRPYRSVYYYGYYPRWWKPYHPVPGHVYRGRTVKYRSATFGIFQTTRVKTVTGVKYHPRSSSLVKTKTTVKHSKGETTVTRNGGGKKTTVTRSGGGKRTTVTHSGGGKQTTVTRAKSGKKNN